MNNFNSETPISTPLHFERVKLIFNARIQFILSDSIGYPQTDKPSLKELCALLQRVERLEELKGE